VASPEAKNLEAISRAIDQHNANCPYPAAEVRMNPFEVERLGWEQIRGLPVVPDGNIGTGRFRIVCSRDLEGDGLEEVEAVGRELETVAPVEN
jgi:ActR/RegA family two-component response regulator